MRVYRIEHQAVRNDGEGGPLYARLAPHYIGPFRRMPVTGDCGANEYIDASGKSWFHFNSLPCPADEGLPFEDFMICGCTSIDQLRLWFYAPLGLQALERMGFVVRAYDVPDIAVNVGEHQCTFPYHAATPAEELPVMALAA